MADINSNLFDVVLKSAAAALMAQSTVVISTGQTILQFERAHKNKYVFIAPRRVMCSSETGCGQRGGGWRTSPK